VPRKAQFFDKFLQDRLGVDAREFLSKNAMEQVDVRRMDAITIVDHHEMAQAQGVEAIPRPHHVSGVEGMNQVGVTPALQQAVKRAARGEKAIVLTLSQDGSPARVYGLDEYLGKRGCLSRDSHGDQDGWEVTTRAQEPHRCLAPLVPGVVTLPFSRPFQGVQNLFAVRTAKTRARIPAGAGGIGAVVAFNRIVQDSG
jgi:hypothetical protein